MSLRCSILSWLQHLGCHLADHLAVNLFDLLVLLVQIRQHTMEMNLLNILVCLQYMEAMLMRELIHLDKFTFHRLDKLVVNYQCIKHLLHRSKLR